MLLKLLFSGNWFLQIQTASYLKDWLNNANFYWIISYMLTNYFMAFLRCFNILKKFCVGEALNKFNKPWEDNVINHSIFPCLSLTVGPCLQLLKQVVFFKQRLILKRNVPVNSCKVFLNSAQFASCWKLLLFVLRQS